ncbi:sodium/glutamate symport carrier protein [Desulfosporosinus acididurans]|uniref:Sodium/glutamate symport carrier protein n=1 Tax=Desulfosporosinus acididurans TaxID=476652 RepID=A0A0J1IHG3_9FIRM|nr:sodium/glutamate symporter [Desulfosporosinus acididurans]KLU64116.1 sodium/glutamate symport carrier protein [Desulfosporosinus acididurans]
MNFNSMQTITAAGLFLLFGYYLQSKIIWLRKLYIPAPFIGGILASGLFLCFKSIGHVKYNLDYSMLPVFVAGFFASIGLRTDRTFLKKGYKGQILFLGIVIFVALFQNVVSLLVSKAVGYNPFQTVIFGSMGLMGDASILQGVPSLISRGHAYLGLFNGYSVFGNIFGTLLGGCLFILLKKRTQLESPNITPIEFKPYEFLQHLLIFLLTICLGLLPTQLGFGKWINPAGGAFLAGLIIRQLFELTGKSSIQSPKVNIIGNFSLSMLLIISFMSMDLTALAKLNPAAILIFALQACILMFFSFYFVFRYYKRNALAAYVASGLIGFSLGMPASTMSTLQCIGEQEGAIPIVLYIVPPVGAWLISVFNPYIIKLFL